ncbi:MAG: hypothetical protein IKK10_03315 [Clostridia bacterium]|nr:hypothetical protein [Clostridia bacterium]
MTDLKAKLDADLSYLNINSTEEDIIEKANRKPIKKYTRTSLIAAALVIVITAGIFCIPNLFDTGSKYGFTVYAGDNELSDKKFVVISEDDETFIHFDFNKILDKNADADDITRRYLVHSFEKRFKLKIEGDSIYNVSYRINNGTLMCYEKTYYTNSDEYYGVSFNSTYTKNGVYKNSIYLGYDRQDNYTFSLTPREPVNNTVRMSYDLEKLPPYIALPETGEILTDENFDPYFPDRIHVDAEALGYTPVAYGFMSDEESFATDEEIAQLTEYAKVNDMVSFYNYQNRIFKRVIDETELHIFVWTNEARSEYEPVVIEFKYNPVEVTETDLKNANPNHSYSLSKGTLSAKLADMPVEQENIIKTYYSNPIRKSKND